MPFKLPQFIEGATAASRCIETAEPTHWVITLLDASVVLFHTIIEILIRTMLDLFAQRFTNRPWIGCMPIRRHSFGHVSRHHPCLTQKALCCIHITCFAQHRIDQVTLAIDCSIPGAPCAVQLHVRFVDVPRAASLACTPGAKLVGQQWGESCVPLPNRFVCKHNATLQKQFGQVTQTEFVAKTPHDSLHNDVIGECEVVAEGSSPFVKGTTAPYTTEGSMAELRSSRTFTCRGRSTIGAGHQHSSRSQHRPASISEKLLLSQPTSPILTSDRTQPQPQQEGVEAYSLHSPTTTAMG